MSDIRSTTYDDVVSVTLSDTVNDPAGPFTGLLVTAAPAGAADVKITTAVGTTITIKVGYSGQIIPITVKRVWFTGTVGTVLGLRAMPYAKTGA